MDTLSSVTITTQTQKVNESQRKYVEILRRKAKCFLNI